MWFVLHPSPNSQTDQIWAPWDLEEEEMVCQLQGDFKVMALVALIDQRVLTVRWMENEQGRPASVNDELYLRMLREMLIWAGRRGHW